MLMLTRKNGESIILKTNTDVISVKTLAIEKSSMIVVIQSELYEFEVGFTKGKNQYIRLEEDIYMHVVDIHIGKVRYGIEAPMCVKINRKEVQDQIDSEL